MTLCTLSRHVVHNPGKAILRVNSPSSVASVELLKRVQGGTEDFIEFTIL